MNSLVGVLKRNPQSSTEKDFSSIVQSIAKDEISLMSCRIAPAFTVRSL